MEKTCVFSKNAPPAAGPYSHAVTAGNLLFLSGQGAMAPDGSGIQRGTIESETRQTLENIKTVLNDAGSSLAQVVKMTVYLKDMENFAAMNAIYKEYFPENPPARTCIQAGRLPLDFQVEMDAIAILPNA